MTATDWGVEVRTERGVWRVDRGHQLTLGRDHGSDVSIADPMVSRTHAIVESTDQGFQLRDVSRNGVYVGGVRRPIVAIVGPVTVNLGAADGPSVVLEPTAYQDAGDVSPATVFPENRGHDTVIRQPPKPIVRIGRATDNDICLDDLLVSRHHAELRSTPAGVEIVDLDSHNGTYLNGMAVTRAPVGVADVVAIGSRLYRIRDGSLEPYVEVGGARFVTRDITVVTKSGMVLVDDVSFALDGGAFLGVVGPSGSGKSTLLRALSGSERAQRGRISFDGRDLYTEFAALRSRIGMVPQDDIVQTDLTVGASLRYAAELRFPPDVPRAEREARVEEVMEQLALSHRRDTVITSLSGGQRKRVSVATELLTRPALLFLDEPTSGLDPGLERSLMQTLRELADGGRIVVCVTHSVESLQLCDRVLFLAPGGHVAFFGPPERATSYFDQPDLQTVFQALSTETGWTERFHGSPLHDEFVLRPLAAPESTPPTAAVAAVPLAAVPEARHVRRRMWLRQFSTFSRRYARSLFADRRNLLIMLATGPVLGLVFLLRLPTDQLRSLQPGEVPDFSRATAPLMLLTIAMTQLGVNISARQIVRELPLFRRERAIGLSITAYVASKFAVLAGIGALQALVCVLISIARQGGPSEGAVFPSGRGELVIVFFVTWLAAMTLGLLCSAVATSEQRLNLVLPAIVGLQALALTGTAVANLPSVPVLDQTSYVASASWGFSAAASTVELNRLNALNNALLRAEGTARTDPRTVILNTVDPFNGRVSNELQAPGNADFDHDASTWWRSMLVLSVLTVGALIAAVLALRRYDPL